MLFARRKNMQLFDLHCDTLYRSLFENQGFYQNDFDISISKAKIFSNWIQCFAIWIPDTFRGKKAIDLLERSYSRLIDELNKNQEFIIRCKDKEDLEKAQRLKKFGAIFTIEGSAALGGDISLLDRCKEMGVKVITLTWNGVCEAGDGALVENLKGITPFGKKLIKRMNELDIIIDVSHASDKLFYDALSLSKKPIIATHSNSRKVCNHKRNLTDDQLKCIKENNGIVGINLCKDFLNAKKEADFSDIERHIYHLLSILGEDKVAFGGDLDGADLPIGYGGILGMETLYEYLLKRNYKEELLYNIFWNNAYNFFANNI